MVEKLHMGCYKPNLITLLYSNGAPSSAISEYDAFTTDTDSRSNKMLNLDNFMSSLKLTREPVNDKTGNQLVSLVVDMPSGALTASDDTIKDQHKVPLNNSGTSSYQYVMEVMDFLNPTLHGQFNLQDLVMPPATATGSDLVRQIKRFNLMLPVRMSSNYLFTSFVTDSDLNDTSIKAQVLSNFTSLIQRNAVLKHPMDIGLLITISQSYPDLNTLLTPLRNVVKSASLASTKFHFFLIEKEEGLLKGATTNDDTSCFTEGGDLYDDDQGSKFTNFTNQLPDFNVNTYDFLANANAESVKGTDRFVTYTQTATADSNGVYEFKTTDSSNPTTLIGENYGTGISKSSGDQVDTLYTSLQILNYEDANKTKSGTATQNYNYIKVTPVPQTTLTADSVSALADNSNQVFGLISLLKPVDGDSKLNKSDTLTGEDGLNGPLNYDGYRFSDKVSDSQINAFPSALNTNKSTTNGVAGYAKILTIDGTCTKLPNLIAKLTVDYGLTVNRALFGPGQNLYQTCVKNDDGNLAKLYYGNGAKDRLINYPYSGAAINSPQKISVETDSTNFINQLEFNYVKYQNYNVPLKFKFTDYSTDEAVTSFVKGKYYNYYVCDNSIKDKDFSVNNYNIIQGTFMYDYTKPEPLLMTFTLMKGVYVPEAFDGDNLDWWS